MKRLGISLGIFVVLCWSLLFWWAYSIGRQRQMASQTDATVTILVHHYPGKHLAWRCVCVPPEGCVNMTQVEAQGEELSEALENLAEKVADWELDMLEDLYEDGLEDSLD